jgi:hypothetical protein
MMIPKPAPVSVEQPAVWLAPEERRAPAPAPRPAEDATVLFGPEGSIADAPRKPPVEDATLLLRPEDEPARRPVARPGTLADLEIDPVSAVEAEVLAAEVVEEVAPPPRRKAAAPVEEEVLEAEVAEEVSPRPARRFGWFAPLLVLVGSLAAGAAAAAPFLDDEPAVDATGSLRTSALAKRTIPGLKNIDWLPELPVPGGLLLVVPVGLALLGLVLFAILAVRRRFGPFSTFFAYLLTIGVGLMLVVLLIRGYEVVKAQERIVKDAALYKQHNKVDGDARVAFGLSLPEAVGASGAATLCLILATMLMHPSWLGRILFLFFILALLGGLGFVAYLTTLGQIGR